MPEVNGEKDLLLLIGVFDGMFERIVVEKSAFILDGQSSSLLNKNVRRRRIVADQAEMDSHATVGQSVLVLLAFVLSGVQSSDETVAEQTFRIVRTDGIR